MTCTHVYAIPGAHCVIDQVHPVTGLTVILGLTRAEVLKRDPGAVLISWDDWLAQQAERQHTPITWTPTTAEKYEEMLNILPPAGWMRGGFLVGEPTDHDFASGRPRYDAFRQRDAVFETASRPLTLAEFRKEMNA